MTNTGFSRKVISWYNQNKRDLPWRNTNNPYIIWLSEIILQQTRVDQGLPYFLRFVEHYPTVKELAEAEEQQVLRHWQGLGYYSRARNLHATAKYVSNTLNGRFPTTFKDLQKLKGVGEYTAAAIASFSFSEVVPVVDGNVSRVLSRHFGLDWDLSKSDTKKKFFELAQELISREQPDLFNQGIMEFGALQCKPKNPDCSVCPLIASCEAYRLKKVQDLPVKTKKQVKKNLFYYYIIFESDSRFLMQTRTNPGIWKGLNEFYLIDSEHDQTTEHILEELEEKHLSLPFLIQSVSDEIIHILSHRKIHAFFIHLRVEEADFNKLKTTLRLKDVSKEEIEKLPKPVLIDNYLNRTLF